jgi:hypothetical protein
MAVTAYNLYEFNQGLIGLGYDQQTRAQVENYLISHGYSANTSPTAPTDILVPTNVMITGGRNFTVDTSANPSLSYILDPGATTMTLTGSTSVGISLASGSIDLIMKDSGNDTVYTGSGSDTINASLSTGNDTLYASGGGDATITGGSGADSLIALNNQGPTGVGPGGGGGELISGSHSGGPGSLLVDTGAVGTYTLQGGAGADTLYASNAAGDTLIAGGTDTGLAGSGNEMWGFTGNNLLEAADSLGSGAFNSMQAGAGNDTLDASNSSFFQALYSGTGNSTLDGGSYTSNGTAYGEYFGIYNQGNGHDTVTINSAAGPGVVNVDMTDFGGGTGAAYSSSDVTSPLPPAGSDPTVTLTFNSGQTIDINTNSGNTVNLEFTDKTVSYTG